MTDLVLVHPFPFDGRQWQELAALLLPSIRLHAPDLPGFGRSTEPAVPSIDAMADAVRRYVDEKRLGRFALGGLSMGGYVTLAYWRRHPDRRPASLLLACTKAEGDGEVARRNRDETMVRLRQEGGLGPYADRMDPLLMAKGAGADLRRQVRGWITDQRLETVIQTCAALRDRRDDLDTLATIDVPTLVLSGEADGITPPAGMEAMARLITGAAYVRLNDVGHLAHLEAPALFAEALRRHLAAIGPAGLR